MENAVAFDVAEVGLSDDVCISRLTNPQLFF